MGPIQFGVYASFHQPTRILVADVLEQVESGMACDAIIEEWRGTLPRDAIVEAVRMAREALVTKSADRKYWTKRSSKKSPVRKA